MSNGKPSYRALWKMGGQQKDLSHFTVSRLWPLSQVWLLSWTEDETNVVATTEHSIWICLCLYFITFCLIWVFIEKFSFLQISECSSYWTHIWGHAADGSSLQAELTIHGRPGGIPENKHQTQVTTFYTCMHATVHGNRSFLNYYKLLSQSEA